MTTTKLPREILDTLSKIDNVGLAISKLAQPLKKPSKKGRESGSKATATQKDDLFFNKIAGTSVPDIYRKAFKRWQGATPTEPGFRKVIRVKSDFPSLCGMGEPSPLENNLAMFHTYGVPYLPGSSLKGVARAYCAERYAGDWGPDGDAFHTLFGEGGDMGMAGAVDFLDAWLDPFAKGGDKPWKLDILTPHHKEWYQGKGRELPSGFRGPIPVRFLAVHATFRLVLEGPHEWVERAAKILLQALEQHGVGAKTRAGYGRFTRTVLDKNDESVLKEKELEQFNTSSPTQKLALLKRSLKKEQAARNLKSWLRDKPTEDSRFSSISWQDPELQPMIWEWISTAGILKKWKRGSSKEKTLAKRLVTWKPDPPPPPIPGPIPGLDSVPKGEEIGHDGTEQGTKTSNDVSQKKLAFGTNVLRDEGLPNLASLSKNKQPKARTAFARRVARGKYDEPSVKKAIEFLKLHKAPDGTIKIIFDAYYGPVE